MNEAVLNVRRLTITLANGFFLQKKTVIQNLSFAAFNNEHIGIVGNNGTGKSTLLKAICCLIKIHSGSISFYKNSIGYLPENYSGPLFLTCEQFMQYVGMLKGLSCKNLLKQIVRLFGTLDLTAYARVKIMNLSKGTAQKLYIAQAVINQPDLLLLDEPFSGLDQQSTLQLSDFLKTELQTNTTIIESTHVPDYSNFDKIIFL